MVRYLHFRRSGCWRNNNTFTVWGRGDNVVRPDYQGLIGVSGWFGRGKYSRLYGVVTNLHANRLSPDIEANTQNVTVPLIEPPPAVARTHTRLYNCSSWLLDLKAIKSSRLVPVNGNVFTDLRVANPCLLSAAVSFSCSAHTRRLD